MEKVKFSFDPKVCAEEVSKVGTVGDFLFYESNLTGHSCETGRVYEDCLKLAEPNMRGDATSVIEEPTEYAYEVAVQPGRYMFFEIIE